MIFQEAKSLMLHTIVMWNNDPDDCGTVTKLGSRAFYVNWANGLKGWIDYENARKISARYIPLVGRSGRKE